MKRIDIFLICAVMLLMGGCSSTAQQEISGVENSTTSDIAENFQTRAETTTFGTKNTETTEITQISTEEINRTEEEKQIQSLLQESRKIFYDYVFGKEMQNRVDWENSIPIEKINNQGESYKSAVYEIADGDVLSFADMREKMSPFFTDKFIDYIFEEHNYYYYEENGKLYVSDGVGSEGGGVGTDTVHITSSEKTDEDTLVLYMTDFGAGENWGLDYDLVDDFTVTLKMTDSGYKIDECDKIAINSLAWCYIPEDDVF